MSRRRRAAEAERHRASRAPTPDRLRVSRAILSALLAAGLVAGVVALERGLGPRALRASGVPAEISGAWFCPHGGGEGWRAWVVVANPTPEPADLLITTYGSKRPVAQTLQAPAGTQRFVEVGAPEAGSSTSVEFFGGPVTAGMVVTRSEGGLAAEPCAETSSPRWYLTEATTVRGFGERLVVMNPFAERAVFDVVLTTEEELLRPTELTGVVVGPRRATAFDLDRFALEKRTLTATVSVDIGKVVAGGLGVSEAGLRATLPATAPSTVWVLPGAGDQLPSALAVTSPSAVPAPFRVRVQAADGQTEVVSDGEALAFRGTTLEIAAPDAGLLAVAEGVRPLIAQRRLVREGDLASTGGAPGGGVRWVAHPVTTPAGGPASLLLENPGDEVAEVRLSLLTAEGPAEAPSIARIVLPPGRMRVLPLTDLVGEQPVSILVEAQSGTVVAAQAALAAEGYAVAVGGRIPI